MGLADQAERIRAHGTTVNSWPRAANWFLPSLNVYFMHSERFHFIRAPPRIDGAVSRDRDKLARISACILNPALIEYRDDAPQILRRNDLHNFRAGPPPRRLVIFTRASCRVASPRRDGKRLDIKITHRRDIGEQRDRIVNMYVTGLPTYPSSASSRCLTGFISLIAPGPLYFKHRNTHWVSASV